MASLREKQRLTLTVADKVQATFGPDKGFVVEPATGLVLASESLVAHDMVSLAWLIECRRAVPEEQMKGRRDPYTRPFIVNMGNRWVVQTPGGHDQGRGVGAAREKRSGDDLGRSCPQTGLSDLRRHTQAELDRGQLRCFRRPQATTGRDDHNATRRS